MKKITKIYVAVMVLLVMLTNISYSVTYSLCGMSSMPKNCCDVGNKDSQSSFKKVSCCKLEVMSVSNNADFTKVQEKSNSTEFASIAYVLTDTRILSEYLTPKENLIFHVPKRDLPVQYSRLII